MENFKYIFIDYENVQPDFLTLPKDNFKIFLFYGADQNLSNHLQKLIEKTGSKKFQAIKTFAKRKNSLDFVLALHIGKCLNAIRKNDEIYIVSKDNDFQSITEQLNGSGYFTKQINSLNILTDSKNIKINSLIKFIATQKKPYSRSALIKLIMKFDPSIIFENDINKIVKFFKSQKMVIYIDSQQIKYKPHLVDESLNTLILS